MDGDIAIKIIGLATLLGCTIVLLSIWFAAAATGNSLLVTVNDYGERTPELLFFAVAVPAVAYFLVLLSE